MTAVPRMETNRVTLARIRWAGFGGKIMGRAPGAARVLYVTEHDPSHKFGSLEEHIVTLAAQSKARGGLLVPVFSGPVSEPLSTLFTASDAPFEPSLDFRLWRWSLARRLLDLVDRYAIDVVDFSFYSPLSPYVTLLRAVRPRLRLIYTDHRSRLPDRDLSKRARRPWLRIALRQYHKILAISDFTYRILSKEGGPRLARCQLFINPARFRPDLAMRERVRAELRADGVFVAIVVANLIRWKGVDVALRAMAAASDSANLWIVGDGPELQNLKRLADQLNLSARVTFLGERQDVSPFLQAADCLICPSIWQEAMGFVNLEAMATGLPVVASRIGGIPEFVADQTTGILVEPGDIGQTKLAFLQLIDSPDLRRRLGGNGITRVSALYSKEACVERYLENYDSVAGIGHSRIDCRDTESGRDCTIAGTPDA
jgi:glycosyltransferase involved in cell wall biosynthesis